MIKTKGFKLDEKGDIVIENGKIAMISDNDLTAQTVRTVLGTKKGEWIFNKDEGIEFAYLVGKGITEDMIRTQIERGVRQVDENMHLSSFEADIDTSKRIVTVRFTAAGGVKSIQAEKIYS